MKWLDTLKQFNSVEDLRVWMGQRNPGLSPGSLDRLAIVGAADEGGRLYGLCEQRGIHVEAICDGNAQKHGLAVGVHRVQSIDTIANLDPEIPIIIASHRVLKITETLRAMGVKHVAPFALLEVLDPKGFPPHMFYEGWLEDLIENRQKYEELANLLADEKSRQVLDAVLGFRMTLAPEILTPIVEWDLYGAGNLLTYSEHEVYVDGGAYDGDTIRLFMDRVNRKFSRILAFEPDKETYQHLVNNFAHEARVTPINAGLYSCNTTLRFDNAGTRGSILVEEGKIEVEVVSLDEVLENDRVSYIKMNIEGAELAALQGSERAIKQWGPKLAISAYHRPSDLWEVPQRVSSIRPDYRLYLRQHDGGVIETVLYALV